MEFACDLQSSQGHRGQWLPRSYVAQDCRLRPDDAVCGLDVPQGQNSLGLPAQRQVPPDVAEPIRDVRGALALDWHEIVAPWQGGARSLLALPVNAWNKGSSPVATKYGMAVGGRGMSAN